MKLHLNELKLNVQTSPQRNVVIYADYKMKAAVWKKRGKKIVALNRSIRKNLIKVKEFTRQHNCGRGEEST